MRRRELTWVFVLQLVASTGAATNDCFDPNTADCDGNGIADGCDLDPNDPDGDGVVALDCNGDGRIDRCQIDRWNEGVPIALPGGSPLQDNLQICTYLDRLAIADRFARRLAFYRLANGHEWRLESEFFESERRYEHVALWGDRAVATRWMDGLSPRVAFLHRAGGTWSEVQTFEGGSSPFERFGLGVGLWGARALICGQRSADDHNKHTLEYAGTWTITGSLGQGATSGGPGRVAALQGDFAVKSDAFRLQVLRRTNGIWQNADTILAPPPRYFASDVALSGNRIAVPLFEFGQEVSGRVRVYAVSPNGTMSLQQVLSSDGTQADDKFGVRVTLDGDRLLVGAPLRDTTRVDAGMAYLYRMTDEGWVLETPLAPPPLGRGYVGDALSLTGRHAFVAGPGHMTIFTWWYGADCDGDGMLDDCQIADGAADVDGNHTLDACESDCNGNGVPDQADVNPVDPDGDGVVLPDCDGNLIPDSCDLGDSSNRLLDCDSSGVPDLCQLDSDTDIDNDQVLDTCERRGDLDGSGTVGLEDLLLILGQFGCKPDCPVDADGDGDTDLDDLLVVLLNFGE